MLPRKTSTPATMSDAPLTPGQIRAARQLLGWTASKLATRVCVSEKTILAFEAGEQWSPPRSPPLYLDRLRERLESAGVIFVEENGEGPGVRLRKNMDKAHVIGRDGKSAYRITPENKVYSTKTGDLFGNFINNRIIDLDGVDRGGLEEFGKVP